MLNLIKIRGVSTSGKWIYSFIDDDILQNNNGTYIVIWNIDTANFQLKDKSNQHLLPLNKQTAKEYTIIGSLYDKYLN